MKAVNIGVSSLINILKFLNYLKKEMKKSMMSHFIIFQILFQLQNIYKNFIYFGLIILNTVLFIKLVLQLL